MNSKVEIKKDNAANRKSYVGHIFNIGEKKIKQNNLDSFSKQFSDLHKEGSIHIHDLDAFGLTYNCLTFDILNSFPYENFKNLSDAKTIIGIFDFLKELFEQMGNEQSGGMSLANFDNDLAEILEKLGIKKDGNEETIKAGICSLIMWCNNNHTRMGQTSYYVSLNIGLANNDLAYFIAYTLIDEFENSNALVYKPNIIFKIVKGINWDVSDKNYNLLIKSLQCTTKKMIPTYLNCDCEMNKVFDPAKLSIMGCRTRVAENLFDYKGAIGRSNIANATINLPRIALKVKKENENQPIDFIVGEVKKAWLKIAEVVKDILIHRFNQTCLQDKSLFPTNLKYKLWCADMNKENLLDVFKNGTLSIGFIGLSEMIEIITNQKYWLNDDLYKTAIEFVAFMRKYTDQLKEKYNLNFSLLGTNGELISGRFEEIDRKDFDVPLRFKGFYTNSFHIEVDSGLPAYKKLEIEGAFHNYTSGGCISYVELNEAPIGNEEGLRDLLNFAIESQVHYCGFNFKKDICKKCQFIGIFDQCEKCGCKEVIRVRRVSGYLEIEDGFTTGKKNESKLRTKN